jgi:hypothetical protein
MPNEALMAELDAWAAEARVDPRGFDCRFYDRCNVAPVELDRGNTAVMSYIGREYGEPSIMPMPRLMIVGMDHGQPCHMTFEGRREQIEGYEEAPGEDFNQHYKGVVRTAAAFLGGYGAHCATACKARCSRSGGTTVDACVLDRLAQPNLVKCVSLNVPNMTCRATDMMRTNCCHHLFAEIGLLRPDIVVVHGVDEKWHVLNHMRLRGIEHQDLADRTGVNDVLYSAPALRCHFVFLLHPSRNWMDRTWDARALPTLAYLTNTGILQAASAHG